MPTHASILLIDDSPGGCELFRTALAQTQLDVLLYTEQDAETALHFLRSQSGLPSLILLDWHLHKTHGDEFLKRLRAEHRFAAIPVVVFSTSDDASDLSTSYGHGANGYVVKPDTFDELVSFAAALCRFWLRWNRTPSMVETKC